MYRLALFRIEDDAAFLFDVQDVVVDAFGRRRRAGMIDQARDVPRNALLGVVERLEIDPVFVAKDDLGPHQGFDAGGNGIGVGL